VTAFLRYIGILNVALWLGAAIFLVIGLPAVFSEEAKAAFGPGGPVAMGWAAERILSRFFILQYCCGSVALFPVWLEWIYCGKALLHRCLGILLVMIGLGLAGGLWMQPRIKELQHAKYYAPTQAARDQAAHAFIPWHLAAECGNLATIGGLLIYLARVSRPGEHARFGNLNLDKIRG